MEWRRRQVTKVLRPCQQKAARQGVSGYGTRETRDAAYGTFRCRRNMRSSSFRKIESSALIGHGGIRRGVVDVGERSRAAESAARGKEAAHYTGAGRRGIRHERALGAETAGAHASKGRRWVTAWPAWAAVEP